MKVVVVGGDAAAHALAVTLGRTAEVVVTPGNPGIPGSVITEPLDLDADLFVISPEAPLVEGLADQLRAQGKAVYGPGADGAMIEGSKAWMKDLVAAAGVPTARYASFSEVGPALEFLRSLPAPWVVKTDGLAAGKGVLVTTELVEAEDDVRAKLAGDSFGDAGRTVVIEEGMTGPELSILAVCDGKSAVSLAASQDFKRIFDDDQGPNTGGMGAYSPVPVAGQDVIDQVMREFVEPTLAELNRRGIDYRGTLYAGLMLTPDGPKLVEYNCRFGDPETQAVMPRITSDLAQLLLEAANGSLLSAPTFDDGACVAVCLACEGYPESPRTGDVIDGLDTVNDPDVEVFCAGVGELEGHLVTNGGRVLTVSACGPDIASARAKAYAAADQIRWPGRYVRTDIALRASEEEKKR